MSDNLICRLILPPCRSAKADSTYWSVFCIKGDHTGADFPSFGAERRQNLQICTDASFFSHTSARKVQSTRVLWAKSAPATFRTSPENTTHQKGDRRVIRRIR